MSSNAIRVRQLLLSPVSGERAQAIGLFASPFNLHTKCIALESALLMDAAGGTMQPSEVAKVLRDLSDHVDRSSSPLVIDEINTVLEAVHHWSRSLDRQTQELWESRRLLADALLYAVDEDPEDFALHLVA